MKYSKTLDIVHSFAKFFERVYKSNSTNIEAPIASINNTTINIHTVNVILGAAIKLKDELDGIPSLFVKLYSAFR